ncbi:hypothetical protein M9Y10_024416 [Tritrichomonas musculus]|uniref:Uncharacterized protein n=1 Tax=Tritrichomonas musculus TaxID=1915356 RepID=A0ABR2HBY2_9EUKA
MISLIKERNLDEVKFISSKNYHWDSISMAAIIFIYLYIIPDGDYQEGLIELLKHDQYNSFRKLYGMGYKPTVYAISCLYQETMKPFTKNFEIIDYLYPNESLDMIKNTIANYHPFSITVFAEKFGNRITNDNWGIDNAHCWFNYKHACDQLKIIIFFIFLLNIKIS